MFFCLEKSIKTMDFSCCKEAYGLDPAYYVLIGSASVLNFMLLSCKKLVPLYIDKILKLQS